MAEAQTGTKKPLKDRLQGLLSEYGALALWVYFGIFFVVLAGFATAISFGFEVESEVATAGTLGAAYVATKVTQPLRILATLVFTPVVATFVRRVRGR
jgi:hypothetical protein